MCCFNPRTPCGVRHAALEVPAPEILVSIHAPRAGCDPWTSTTTTDTAGFNPRTPCGVRPQKVENIACYFKFQSTHPVRGATGGGREARVLEPVSIHAPRAGCDGIRRPRLASPSSFNPRTPCGVRPRS